LAAETEVVTLNDALMKERQLTHMMKNRVQDLEEELKNSRKHSTIGVIDDTPSEMRYS
jgi:hypothetical protein